jgi:hypothetical protein
MILKMGSKYTFSEDSEKNIVVCSGDESTTNKVECLHYIYTGNLSNPNPFWTKTFVRNKQIKFTQIYNIRTIFNVQFTQDFDLFRFWFKQVSL